MDVKVHVATPVTVLKLAVTSTSMPLVAVRSTRVLKEVRPDGTLITVLPKPMLPSWKVLQSRFASSCWVTTTVWAGALALGLFSNSIP